MSAVPITGEEDHRPFDLSATLPSIETMRDAVATMALCGEEFEQVRAMIEATRTSCEKSIAEEFHHRTFSLRRDVARAEEELRAVEQSIEEARNNRVRLAELQQKKSSLERLVAGILQEIRKKKTSAEREEFKRLLDQSNNRVRSAEDRLTEEAKAAKLEQHDVWKKQSEEIDRRVQILGERLRELDERLKEARDRAAPLIRRNITRTVAGFLLWVGYGSFAAIGSTIALLLPTLSNDKAPLAHILGAVRSTVAGFPSDWSIGVVFVVSLIVFFIGAVLFGAFVVGVDWLLQRSIPNGDAKRVESRARPRAGRPAIKPSTRNSRPPFPRSVAARTCN